MSPGRPFTLTVTRNSVPTNPGWDTLELVLVTRLVWSGRTRAHFVLSTVSVPIVVRRHSCRLNWASEVAASEASAVFCLFFCGWN